MAGKRILVVEDDKSILDLEERILLDAGYQVDCSTSGSDALEMVKANHYAVVVADVMMPGMDGFDLTREIEKTFKKSLPVLLVTAIPNALKAAHERDAKPVSTLQKPFTPGALLTAVKLLEGRQEKGAKPPVKNGTKPPMKKVLPKRPTPPKKGWFGKLISK